MPIPRNIAAQWSEFVAEWCLGNEPDEAPAEVERAFDALRRLWPELLSQLEARATQGDRGISMVISAIANGLTLAACEQLSGFGPVMARVRRGEGSAWAELEFAAALVRCGFMPLLEPQLGSKTLDCSVGLGSERVYVEVIAPEQAAEINDAYTTIQRMATEIAERTTGTRTEVLLSDEPGTRFDAVLDAATATPPDSRVHNVEGIARVRRDFLGPLPPNAGPLISNHDPRPAIGVAPRDSWWRRGVHVCDGAPDDNGRARTPTAEQRAFSLLTHGAEHSRHPCEQRAGCHEVVVAIGSAVVPARS